MSQGESAGRCIYSGKALILGDEKLKPSREHIVPLALGGSHQFTTNDVSAYSNSRAGNEIDDAVASQLPLLGLRQKYGLKGNRGIVPNVALKGHLTAIPDAPATLEIDADANVSVRFHNEQRTTGQLVQIGTTEDRMRFFLNARLKQARERNLNILTQYGQIRDEEDIEAVLLLAPRTEGQEFKASLTIDLAAYHSTFVRLMIKIALCLGHRVLGPSWTFSPSGDLLRQGLWPNGVVKPPPIRGSVSDQAPDMIAPLIGIAPNKHVMAVLPVGHDTTVAIIAMFGGASGVATIDLGIDSLDFFENFKDEERGGCVFEIPIASDASQRSLVSRTLRDVANAAVSGLFKNSP